LLFFLLPFFIFFPLLHLLQQSLFLSQRRPEFLQSAVGSVVGMIVEGMIVGVAVNLTGEAEGAATGLAEGAATAATGEADGAATAEADGALVVVVTAENALQEHSVASVCTSSCIMVPRSS
jgi:hypothetical protein